MRIPRPSHHGLPDDRESQITLLDSHRAWTFLPSDYPSSAVPNFCQGNAVLLSNDLSSSLTSTNRPFSYYIPDDIMIALAVDFKTAGNFRQFSPFSVAYAHEGSWVKCSEGSGGWYNIHPEYMYLLWENRHGDWCSGIDEIMCCAIN